jgi:ABC transporter with metal-binding/Fe-S-binding domain ATP-binding protein
MFSGGKDSVYAAWRGMQTGLDIACFITLKSSNEESYMFHTPNIDMTRLQSEASGIPLVEQETEGVKEYELEDLTLAIRKAVLEYSIDGIITGAIQSVYQASRIERICHSLGLWCLSPLWLCNQEQYVTSIINEGFKVIIAGVFAEPLDESWLGKEIDLNLLSLLKTISGKYHLSLAGEGGEYESFVCNAPFFHKKIVVEDAVKDFCYGSGRYTITRASLHQMD